MVHLQVLIYSSRTWTVVLRDLGRSLCSVKWDIPVMYTASKTVKANLRMWAFIIFFKICLLLKIYVFSTFYVERVQILSRWKNSIKNPDILWLTRCVLVHVFPVCFRHCHAHWYSCALVWVCVLFSLSSCHCPSVVQQGSLCVTLGGH